MTVCWNCGSHFIVPTNDPYQPLDKKPYCLMCCREQESGNTGKKRGRPPRLRYRRERIISFNS